MITPELHYASRTPWVPGSPLPIIVYRGALAHCETEETMREALEANGGWRKGGAWGAAFKAHFHPNVHECYGVASGTSKLSLGRGPLDPPDRGLLLEVTRGDVVVLPAGIAHCSSTATADYKIVVLFPTGGPKWISVWCDQDEAETDEWERQCLEVAVPKADPLYGEGKGLVEVWGRVLSGKGAA